MKRFLLQCVCVVAISLVLGACSGLNRMVNDFDDVNIRTHPEILEYKNDSVKLFISVSIPEKYLHRNAYIRVEPELRTLKDTSIIYPFVLLGENAGYRPEEGVRQQPIRYDNGGIFRLEEKIPYDSSLFSAEVYLDIYMHQERRIDRFERSHELRTDRLMIGTKATPLRASKEDYVIFEGDAEPAVKKDTFQVSFEINSAAIGVRDRESERIQNLKEFVKQEGWELESVSVQAFSSPDGPYGFNKRLTQQRAVSASRFVTREIKALSLDHFREDKIRIDQTEEDWWGFKQLVSEVELEHQDEILSLLEEMDFLYEVKEKARQSEVLSEERYRKLLDEKEAEIREFEEDWKIMAQRVFPKLRRANLNIKMREEIRTLSEIMETGANEPDKLTSRELILYARNLDHSDEAAAIYQKFIDRNPDNWIGYNDYGARLIKDGAYGKALEILERGYELDSLKQPLINNLALAYFRNGAFNEAAELFIHADSDDEGVKSNKVQLFIRMGHYEEALKLFSGDQCSHNLALSYILNDESDKALDVLECIPELDAELLYLRAIAAARTGDIDLMSVSLTRAADQDNSYRYYASKDVEFKAYWRDVRFLNAIE